jgi:hypothetical protein
MHGQRSGRTLHPCAALQLCWVQPLLALGTPAVSLEPVQEPNSGLSRLKQHSST